jgi:hypothetical protein
MSTCINNDNESYDVVEMTTAETRELFDKTVKEQLGMTAEEFIKKYRAGGFDTDNRCEIMELLMLLPFTGYSQIYGKNCGSSK